MADSIVVSQDRTGQKRFGALRAVLSYARPHRFAFLAVIVCTFLAVSADLLQPYLVKIAIDDHLAQGKTDTGLILGIAGLYLALSVISFLFTYLQNNVLQYAGQSIVARIRKQLFAHITRLSMSFFDRFPLGSLVTHVSSDTEMISQFFTQVFLSLIRDGLTLALILVLMFRLDATLALYSLLVLPVIAIVAIWFRSYMRRMYQVSRSRLSRLISFIAENLSGMSIIQAFHQEQAQNKRFDAHNDSYWKASLKEARSNVIFNRIFEILGNLSLVLVIWLGGIAVFHHRIEYGVLYAFISYIRLFFQPINQITMQWNTLQSSTVSMERIWSILSVVPEVKEPEEKEAVHLHKEDLRGQIDFNRVRFGYNESQVIIPKLDLHIKPGEMIGIVGSTGAGKSTIIGLLNRFYDVSDGNIEIDSVDIRNIPNDVLHNMIGLIQQEPFLFSGSIIDNVRLFREEISREAVIAACKFVGASMMIERLPQQYDTLLSERGSGLSAGERQLISFARIVVLQPKILILDEATANLDSQTEQLVQQALEAVSAGRTTLVIAHRLSTIRHAHRILVMKQGDIVEEGSHEQLLARDGYYAELIRHVSHAEKEPSL